MADNFKIGASLALDGEAEFKAAISNVNKDLGVLGSEMKKVTGEFSSNADSMDALKAKSEVYNKQVVEQKNKIVLLNGALEDAKTQYGENSNQVKDWQIKLNNAEAQLSKTETALKQTTEQAEKLDKVDLSGFTSGVGKAAGVAGNLLLGIGTAAVAGAAGVGAMTVNAAQNADEINTLSKQLGISTADVQKFQYASEQIDVPLETIAKGLSKTTKAMGAAQDAGNGYIQIADGITVATVDANGKMLSSNDVFNASIDALSKMTNETERDIATQKLFGKSYQDLGPLIEGGSDALKQYGDEAAAAGLILKQEALDNLNSLADAMDTFKATATGSGSLFATAFAGPMAGALNLLTGYMQDLTAAFNVGGFDAASNMLGSIVSDMVEKVTSALPRIIELGITVVQRLVDGIQENLPTLMEGATKIILMLVTSLIEMLPQLFEMGVTILVELANGIAKALPEMVPTIVSVITKIVEVIIQNLPTIILAAVQIIVALAGGLIQAIPELVKAVPDLISALATGFTDALPQILEIGTNIVKGVWKGISDAAAWFTSKVKSFFGGIVKAVKKSLGISSPSKVFAEIGGYMAQGLGVGFTDSMAGVSDKINASVPTNVKMTGTQLVEGVVNGVSTAVGSASQTGGTYTINLQVGEKTLAQVLFDPLREVATQRGVATA